MSIVLRVLGIIFIIISLFLLFVSHLTEVIVLLIFGVFFIIGSTKKPAVINATPVEEMTNDEIITKFRDDMKEDLKIIQGTQVQADMLARIDATSSGKEVTTVVNKEAISKLQNIPELYIEKFKIHDDIKFLLWFGDGTLKNLSREQMASDKDVFTLMGSRVGISLSIDEPSLIYTNAPIKEPQDISIIPRPPYYPKYKDLTPEQRWIYLKLLTNPYNTDIDIGYVFILYYGLERHLLQGDFHSAFNVILKLRDVHKNKSFQSYSGNALILSALLKDKGEYIPFFIKSLDKEYEFGFSDNLFLLSYYSFNVSLFPKDIMRMAKTFEFTNTNYIKKYPEIFDTCLTEIIKEKTSIEYIDIKKYITDAEIKKIHYEKTTIFANSSIIGNTVSVPLLTDNFKLKKEMNALLEAAHEKVKTKLAEMRKSGDIHKIEPIEKQKK